MLAPPLRTPLRLKRIPTLWILPPFTHLSDTRITTQCQQLVRVLLVLFTRTSRYKPKHLLLHMEGPTHSPYTITPHSSNRNSHGNMEPVVSALLFVLGTIGNQLLLPSPILQHSVQSIWLAFRSFFVADADIVNRVTFGRHVQVPVYTRDVFLLPIISLLQTLPSQNILDVAWIPLTIHLCMGYPLAVWYISVNCPFLVVYLAQRPSSFLLLKSTLLWGAYKGDNKWTALIAAAFAHLCAALCYLLMFNTMPHYAVDFRLLGAILAQICAAEAKYQLMFQPHLITEHISAAACIGLFAMSSLSIWSIVPVLTFPVVVGWGRRWKYTDKVVYNSDICIFLGCIAIAYGVSHLLLRSFHDTADSYGYFLAMG